MGRGLGRIRKREVYHGYEYMTDDGLTINDLYLNRRGRIAVKRQYTSRGGTHRWVNPLAHWWRHPLVHNDNGLGYLRDPEYDELVRYCDKIRAGVVCAAPLIEDPVRPGHNMDEEETRVVEKVRLATQSPKDKNINIQKLYQFMDQICLIYPYWLGLNETPLGETDWLRAYKLSPTLKDTLDDPHALSRDVVEQIKKVVDGLSWDSDDSFLIGGGDLVPASVPSVASVASVSTTGIGPSVGSLPLPALEGLRLEQEATAKLTEHRLSGDTHQAGEYWLSNWMEKSVWSEEQLEYPSIINSILGECRSGLAVRNPNQVSNPVAYYNNLPLPELFKEINNSPLEMKIYKYAPLRKWTEEPTPEEILAVEFWTRTTHWEDISKNRRSGGIGGGLWNNYNRVFESALKKMEKWSKYKKTSTELKIENKKNEETQRLIDNAEEENAEMLWTEHMIKFYHQSLSKKPKEQEKFERNPQLWRGVETPVQAIAYQKAGVGGTVKIQEMESFTTSQEIAEHFASLPDYDSTGILIREKVIEGTTDGVVPGGKIYQWEKELLRLSGTEYKINKIQKFDLTTATPKDGGKRYLLDPIAPAGGAVVETENEQLEVGGKFVEKLLNKNIKTIQLYDTEQVDEGGKYAAAGVDPEFQGFD